MRSRQRVKMKWIFLSLLLCCWKTISAIPNCPYGYLAVDGKCFQLLDDETSKRLLKPCTKKIAWPSNFYTKKMVHFNSILYWTYWRKALDVPLRENVGLVSLVVWWMESLSNIKRPQCYWSSARIWGNYSGWITLWKVLVLVWFTNLSNFGYNHRTQRF